MFFSHQAITMFVVIYNDKIRADILIKVPFSQSVEISIGPYNVL